MTDDNENSWEAFEDEWSRRKMRCVEGPRLGDVIDSPFCGDAQIWIKPDPKPDTRTAFQRALDADVSSYDW